MLTRVLEMGLLRATGFLYLLLHAAAPAADNLVELSTDTHVAAVYHKHVDLHCNVSSQAELSIRHLYWMDEHKKKNLCQVHMGTLVPSKHHGIKCEYIPSRRLTLTFMHAKPSHEGKYKCGLISSRGIKQVLAEVRLQDHFSHAHCQFKSSTAMCHFSGVYPKGELHWFEGNRNVTERSTGHSMEPNHDGTFNLSSSLPTDGASWSYNCSLWIPSSAFYLHSKQIFTSSSVRTRQSNAASVHTMGVGCALMLIRLLLL